MRTIGWIRTHLGLGLLALLLCAAASTQAARLDADGNGAVAPATDGTLILRHLFGFTGTALTTGALGTGVTRDAAAITAYLVGTGTLLDVDGDGRRDALTDGVLIKRYLLGRTGSALTLGAIAPDAARTSPAQIAAYLAAVDGQPSLNQALLGPLAGATINAYRLSDLNTPVEGPIAADADLSNLALAGTFQLTLTGIADDEWVLVTATGGQDLDAADDGVLDPTPTTNLGTLHALAKAGDWRRGELKVNVLTEIAWQALAEEIALGLTEDLDGRLRLIANELLKRDLTGDGGLDYRDLTAFDPRSEAFRASLILPFGAFLAEDGAGRSLFDEIHDGQAAAVRNWIAASFGDRLQAPRTPVLVDVAPEVLLPANREGLQGQDILISSAVSSGAQILDQGVTLMIAKDVTGHPVLLAFVLPGQAAQFSPRTTALALVMLAVGGPRDIPGFSRLAGEVTAQVEFDALVTTIANTLAADPFFLDRLKAYVDLLDRIKSIVAAVNASIVPAAASTASARQLGVAAERLLPNAKQDFYCFLKFFCSPWAESEPWDWYGDAKGVEDLWPDEPDHWYEKIAAAAEGPVYLPKAVYKKLLGDVIQVPFIGVAHESQTEIGLANPTAANYAFELLARDGSVSNWYVVPRNSTLFDKLLNSGAAQRSLYSVETARHHKSLDATNAHVRFKRWPALNTAQGQAVSLLNAAHFAISTLNLVQDFSAASKTLEEIAMDDRALGVLGTCAKLVNVGDLLDVLGGLEWDSTDKHNLQQAGGKVLEATVDVVGNFAGALASNEGALCLGKAAKYVGRDWSKLFGQQVVASAVDFLGTVMVVKVALDAANDTIPTVLSMAYPDSDQADYYLTWAHDTNNHAILIDVFTEPTDGELTSPRALFTTEKRAGEGLTVHFDASGSRLDSHATPTFTWDFGDGASGSGEQTSHPFTAAGPMQVRLKVDDGLGQTDERTATIQVRNGESPVIAFMRCRLDSNNARLVLIDAGVTDPDGDLAALQWWRASPLFETAPTEITPPNVNHMELAYPDDGTFAFTPTLLATDAAGNVTQRTCTAFQGGTGTGRLNDTGIDWCANETQNFLACPVANYPWQDAQDGRDKTNNDDSDGHAGFSFTKLDANGNPLAAGAATWSCVRDNVTGLSWEVKTDDGGLRDKDWTYSWYNPDSATNGGSAGYADYGNNCFNPARCDTQKYVADVNAQGLCGAHDWRLPDPRELLSIVSNDRVNPAIDTTYFPTTLASWVWSASPYAYYPNAAWGVSFGGGTFGNDYKYNAGSVRLVRGGQ